MPPKSTTRPVFRPSAHRYALESRQLFDGAAFVEVAAAAAHGGEAPADAHHADLSRTTAEPQTKVPAQNEHAAQPQLAEAATAHAPIPATPVEGHAVYVVDQNVQDWQQVVGSLPKNAEVILISSAGDGVAQLAASLQGRHDISSLYIVSHGAAGEITLGSTTVSASNIADHSAEWRAIGASLTSEGDILLYGCDVASQGVGLLTQMASLTGADVAASTNASGAAVRGGDWTLEAQVGRIEAKAFSDADYSGLLAAPTIKTTVAKLEVSEPSALNAPNADRGTLSGWTITDDGSGNVTLDVVLADPSKGTLSSGSMAGVTGIAGGFRFTGTAAQANAWINQVVFTAANVELGSTAATTTITATVTDLDSPTIHVSRSIAVTVTPSNDPASIADSVASVNEIGNTVLTSVTLNAIDSEVTAGTQNVAQLVYSVAGNPQYGYVMLDGARLGVGSTFTQADVNAGRVVYVHTATGEHQNSQDSFTVRVNDGATPTAQSDTAVITLNVTPLNQGPSVGGSGTVYEGQPANAVDGGGNPQSAVGNFIVADGGGDDAESTLSVRINALPTDGTLFFTGTAIVNGVSQALVNHAVTAADIAAGFSFAYTARAGLTYGNAGQRDNSGAGSYPFEDGFNVTVSDAGGGTGSPGSTADTRIAITVRPANDDPTLISPVAPSATVTVNGDTLGTVQGQYVVTLTTAMLNATDVDSGAERITFAVTSQAGLTHGRILLNGQFLPPGVAFTLADVQAGRVQYVQQIGATAGQVDTFDFQLIDNTFGPRWNPDGTSIQTVGGVYDTNGTASVNDDSLHTFKFTINLAPTTDGNHAALPTQGTATTNNGSSYAGTDATGSSRGALDEGGTVVLSGTGANFTTTPGLSYTADGVPPSQVIYTIVGLDDGGADWNGTLQLQNSSGVWIDLNVYDTFTQADLNAGKVRFQHDGASEDFMSTVRLSASAGVLVENNGTLQPDAWNTSFTFYVRPTNDAPVTTGSSNTVVAEGETIGITTGQLGIADPDDAASEGYLEGTPTLPGLGGTPNYANNNDAVGASSLRFVIDTAPQGGKLQYSTNGGVTWNDIVPGVTQIDASVLTGDAATTGLRFVSDGSELRSTSFTVHAVDRWNANSNTATVGIQITNINDAPQIAPDPTQADPTAGPDSPNNVGGASANEPLTVTEGGYAQITAAMLQAYDPDSTAQQVQYRINSAPAHGNVAISMDGGLTFTALSVGSSFTQADVVAGRIYYISNGDEGDGKTYPANAPTDRFTFDLGDGDKEQAGNAFWIYVNPVNDPPTVTAPTGPIDLDSADPGKNPVPGFTVGDADLDSLTSGETDYMQVTVRLLNADGTAFTAAQYTALGGVTILVTASGAVIDADKNGLNDYLTLRGTKDQINAALATLDVTFGTDRDQTFQVQVIADDRLRAADGTLIANNANGGVQNEPAQPGVQLPTSIPSTEYDWYTEEVPLSGAIIGNIAANSVTVRASSVNDPALLTGGGTATTYEDQPTLIGPGLNLVVSDAESEAFGLPVTITLAVPSGSLGVGASGNDSSITLGNGHVVKISGDNSGSLALTGLASDIEALLKDPALGLTYKSALNVNHDLNASAGDVTLTISFDDSGSKIGGDTGAGSVSANPPPITVAIDITPVNDAPTVSAGSTQLPIVGVTPVPGFSVGDTDYLDGGDPAATPGESDFMQVTVRITDAAGNPLAAAAYLDGAADAIVINSSAAGNGATIDATYDGTGSALVIRGTLAQVNAYLAGLQVQLGTALENKDQNYRVEVIADDRLRVLATGALLAGGAANGGLNSAAGNDGATAVPTTPVDPYGASPALPQNVSSAYRTVFPTAFNDPAHIGYADPGRTEGSATVQLGGIVITDSDALNGTMTATLTLPPGFSFAANGTQTITVTGTLDQLNTQINQLVVNLPTAANVDAADWNGSFTIKIVVNDGGNTGARPGTLAGDTNDPTANPGDFDYADGTTNVLETTRTIVMTVQAVNDAPVVVGGAQVLTGVNEDLNSPGGDSVSNLFAGHFTDPRDQVTNGGPVGAIGGTSSDSFFGIAVTGLNPNPAQGTWQYSTDGGTTWTDIGVRTDTSALILDGAAKIRFVPAGDFFGTPVPLTVRLVENDVNTDGASTAPINGQTRDVTTNGGSTIFSAGTIALATAVANVNDRPTASDASIVAGVEDTAGTAATVGALFGPSYSDAADNQTGISGGGDASSAIGGIAIVGNASTAAQGNWQYSLDGGTSWTNLPTALSDQSAVELSTSAQLRFVPSANFNGAPGALSVRISDVAVANATNVDLGNTAALNADQSSQWSLIHSVTTTVAPRNDAPQLGGTVLSPTVTENGQTGNGISIPTTNLLSGSTLADLDLGSTGALTPGLFGAGSITLSLGNFQAGDELLVNGALPPGVTASAGTNGTLTITFDADTTIAEVEGVLNNLAYRSTSDNPTVFGTQLTRTYSVVVNDGNNLQAGGNAGGGTSLNSNALTGTLTIAATNDDPTANDDVRNVGEDALPISGNVIVSGAVGDVADTDTDNPVTDLHVVAVRTGLESGTGAVGVVGTGLAGAYGTLVLNADGTYSYTVDNNNAAVNGLKTGDTLTEVYTYTISDGAGGSDTAQITITINGHTDGVPSVVPVDGNGGAATGQTDVFEHGLTSVGDVTETNTGTITVSAADGLQSVTVGGTVVTLAQLQNLGSTPVTINTPDGTLVLTGFTAGTSVGGVPTTGSLAYSYTLKAPITNTAGASEATDAIALVVTDAANATSSGTLTIRIVDDSPTATSDVNSVTEDGSATVTGNVVAGTAGAGIDSLGADGASAGGPVTDVAYAGVPRTVGTAFTTAFGSVTLNADGSYSYTLDNTNPAVNALKNGETLTEIVNYTITDKDGDTSSTTLTITINGHTDGVPSVVPVDGNGGAATGQTDVFEHGLTSVGDVTETNTGTITVSAADGLQSVTVGGTVVTLAQLQNLGSTPVTINTPDGTLVLTGFTAGTSVGGVPTTGSLAYSYTLKAPITNTAGASEATDAIALVVTDAANATSSGTLTIRIVDDTPTATSDANSVTEDGSATVTGNVVAGTAGAGIDSLGADGASAGGPVTDVAYAGVPRTVGTAFTTAFGSVTLNADGSYSYTLDNTNPAVNALKNGETLTEIVNYTITDKDGDTSSTTLTITINGHTDGAPSVVPVDGNGGAATGQTDVFEHGLTSVGDVTETNIGTITVSAADGLQSVTVGGTVVTLAQLQNLGSTPVTINTPDGTLVLTGFTAGTSVGGVPTTGSLAYSYTLKAPITNTAGASEATDAIALVVTDAANATSSGTLTIRIVDDTPTATSDVNSVTEDGSATVTGNVVAGTAGAGIDSLGADGASAGGPVTDVAYAGVPRTVGTAFTTAFGSVTLNADGSYSYTLDNTNPAVNALKNGETLTEIVNYTITDKDGDTSSTTLTITINGHTDGAPSVVPVDGNGGAATGQATVYEAGLTIDGPGGQDATTTGTMTLNALDGLKSVNVGGTEVTLAQLQSLGTTSVTIDTGEGTLVLTGFAGSSATPGIVTGGDLSYTYTLKAPIANTVGTSESADTIALVVTDVANATNSGTLTVQIVDDAPAARPDVGSVTEDAAIPTVSGNVYNAGPGADRIGADGADIAGPVTAVSFNGVPGTLSGPLTTQYGSIVLNPDGSYTYTLDNNNAVVNALKDGEQLTEVVTYTILDKDGDASTTTLTLTINGHTDISTGPSIVAVDGNGAADGQTDVFEHGLTSPGDLSETQGGEITISAADGLQSVSVGGTLLGLTDLANLGTTPVVIHTPDGTLTLTGFTATSTVGGIPTAGTLSYTYTVDAQISQPGANDSIDPIALAITDAGNATSAGTLSIRIVDDVPIAQSDTAEVSEDGKNTATGNLRDNDTLGADNANGVPVTQVSIGGQTGSVGNPLATPYGSIVINADGSYTYTLDNNNPAVQHLTTGETLTEVVSYTLTDADGDTSSATLTVTIRGSNDVATLTVVDGNGAQEPGQATVHERGLGDPANTSESTSGRFVISTPDGLASLTVGGTVLTPEQIVGLGNRPVVIETPKGQITLTGFDPATGAVTYTYTLSGQQTHAGQVSDDIAITLLDRDGDSTSGTLQVLVVDDVPTAFDDAAQVSTALPNGTVRGNVVAGGANGGGSNDVPDRIGADITSSPVTGFAFEGRQGVLGGAALSGAYGSLRMNADGSYTYAVNDSNARVASLGDGQILTEVFSYTITDSDGSTSTAQLTITIRGASNWRPLGEQVFPSDFVSPLRNITQGMEPALFVQYAVRASQEQSLELGAAIATRAAGGAVDENAPTDLSVARTASGRNVEYVHDAVQFSQAMARDAEQALALRGLGRGLPDATNALFSAFPEFATPQKTNEHADESASKVMPQRVRVTVPHAESSDRSEPALLPSQSLPAAKSVAADQARSFSARLAATAAERGAVREAVRIHDHAATREGVRVKVPAAPV